VKTASQVEYTARRDVGAAGSVDFRTTEVDKPVEHLRLLWDRRGLIGMAAVIGLLAGILFSFLLPKRYASSTELMPPNNQPGQGMAMLAALSAKSDSDLPGIAGNLLGADRSGALFVGILQSRTIQDRLVQRFDLKKVYWDRLEEDACKDLAERTGITEDRKSGIITITVSDRIPERAAAIARAYVEELDRLSAELSTSIAHRERVFLEERLKAVKLDLDEASQDFSQFASQNSTIDIKEQGRTMVEAAARLQGELIGAQSELKGLEEVYTGNNVRMRSAEARVAELQKQLDKLGGGAVGQGIEPGGASGASYPSIRQLPLLGVKYADLYRRTKIQEALYETLTQQYELAKVQEAKETPSVKVLDPASVPERKSFPPRLALIFVFVSLGLAGGAAWVMLRGRWEEVEPTDPRKMLARDVLDAIGSKLQWLSSRSVLSQKRDSSKFSA
jgi:uncharacterized protein involved in exopolysaccharide biosynthesis